MNGSEGTGDKETAITEAFRAAYPEIPDSKLVHMARNFTQVIKGIVAIGQRVQGEAPPSHMEVVNGMVCSCISGSYLEELHRGEWSPVLEDSSISRITVEEMDRLRREIVARVADWLVGLEVLRQGDPETYRDFVRGALALGAEGWEKERGKLSY